MATSIRRTRDWQKRSLMAVLCEDVVGSARLDQVTLDSSQRPLGVFEALLSISKPQVLEDPASDCPTASTSRS